MNFLKTVIDGENVLVYNRIVEKECKRRRK